MPGLVGIRRSLIIPARSAAGYAGDPDAGAYIARLVTAESEAFKADINTLVLALKADANPWAKLDYLNPWWATSSAANAVLDLRRASEAWEAGVGATFTPGLGFVGSGSAPAIIWPKALDSTGNQFSVDSASFFYRCTSADDVGSTRVVHLGGVLASRTQYLANANSGSENARINQTADSTGIRTSTSRVGSRGGSRTASNVIRYYFNGAFTSAHTTASAATTATKACLGGNGTTYSGDTFGWGASGGGMTDAEAIQVQTAMAAFRTARGIA